MNKWAFVKSGYERVHKVFWTQGLRTSPPLTEVSRALRARNAERVSKMSPGAPRKVSKKSQGHSCKSPAKVSKETEYDRAKVPPYNGNDPRPPLVVKTKTFLFPPLLNKVRKQGNARGASEVRRGTSSIHFHCPVPRSSSHIGHGRGSRA